MPKINNYIQREYNEGDELLTLGVCNGKIAGLFKAADGASYRADAIWPTVAALFQSPEDLGWGVSASGRRIDFNEASIQAMQATGNPLDEIHREQSIKEEKKPMKATLLMHETVPSPSGYEWSTWTGGDQIIDISSSSNLAKEVFDWMRDNHLPRKLLRNVHYDGMLFEHTSKPVLAEVGTGIEI